MSQAAGAYSQELLHKLLGEIAVAIDRAILSGIHLANAEGLLARKSVRYGQRATLVGLQRNFLCQHDVACDEVTVGRKAPTNTRTAGAVELDEPWHDPPHGRLPWRAVGHRRHTPLPPELLAAPDRGWPSSSGPRRPRSNPR